MLHFECDYTTGACEEILDRLVETNRVSQSGYGADEYTLSAKEKVKTACNKPNADVFFLVGGTQTNLTVISALLAPCEGVISANSGHINVHEAGAIEGTGHKVLTVPGKEGKILADTLKKYLVEFYQDRTYTHMTIPGMVYISYPTEYGTLYSKKELTELKSVCEQYSIPLFLDGARLGYGLASDSDMTLEDIANLTDVFYIGGTKVGALCGEAIVFPRGNAPTHFFTHIKQRGALLSKGRLLGIQFDTLFSNGLYFKISEHAIRMADKLRKDLTEKGYRFFIPTVTNQIFVILENTFMNKLKENVCFDVWETFDEKNTVIRFATSWSTTDDELQQLINLL